MGVWVSKPKIGEGKIISLSELKDETSKEITDIKDLRISQGDFIIEKEGRFRDFYKIGPGIGSGSFGEVRKWIHKITNAVRAVKIILKEALKGNEKLRFFYEMEIMKKLDHPNILKIYEVFQDQKRYYLITELWTGGELFDEISKRITFLEKDAAAIIEQILEAVAYWHSK